MSQARFHTVGNNEHLVDRVANQLQRMIIEGELLPGARLPPQDELAAQVGVSRPVVREAVRVLVTRGLLESKPGSGTSVRQVDEQQLVEPLSLFLKTYPDVSIAHLYQVRTVLEVGVAEIAGSQATKQDVEELEQILAEMEVARGDPDKYVDHDLAFHRGLAKTTHNPLLAVFVDSLADILREVLLAVNRNDDPVAHAAWNVPQHVAILDSVKRHDPKAARAAMARHLALGLKNQERVLKSIGAETLSASTPVAETGGGTS